MDSNGSIVTFSVSEFVEYVNLALGQRRVSVEGEISGYHLNQGKWVFFDLKDKESSIGCFAVLWNLHTTLEDGMQVVVHGVPRIYGKSGKFSIMVDAVELRGEGALRRAFELTKKKLEQEGLFDTARKRSLPQFPEKIGVIASRESAAYSDFMRITNQRWGGLEIYLYHVQVQGAHAAGDIIRAFEWFNTVGVDEGVQSLALIRGGGSLEDLQAFNSESVARAVFGSRIPVVCGVGHERDESLADYAADVRAATPTHAVSIMVSDRQELLSTVKTCASSLLRSVEYTLEWHTHGVQSHLAVFQSSLHQHARRFQEVMHGVLRARERIEYALHIQQELCAHSKTRLAEYMDRMVESQKNSLSFYDRTLAQMNPLTVLKRGYTLTRRRGDVVTQRKGVQRDDIITVQFFDGSIDAKTL